MRNLFKYYFKKRWPFMLFISIAAVIINFLILLDYNGSYYRVYGNGYDFIETPPVVFATILAAILASVIPMIEFSFKMKKINVDLMYSLPIKRNKLFISTLLFSIIEVLIPITLIYWQSFFNVLISTHKYELIYFPLYYLILIFISIGLTCIVSFIFCRNNTIVDGAINVAMFATAPMAVVYALQALLATYRHTFFVRKILDGSFYSIYSPFFTMFDKFSNLIQGNDPATEIALATTNYSWTILISMILFTLISMCSVIGLYKFASIDKAENTTQQSTSAFSYKVMIPILVISLFILAHESILLAIGYIGVPAIGLYCFYNRTVKLKTKQWLLIILYLLIGFILAVIAGNVGSTPWMPTPVQCIY